VRQLELILESDAREFPPRLADQPFFYPVLNAGYAEQIARDWNTRDTRSGHAGFVTAFELPDDYLACYDVRVVGAREHQELWVPAGRLPEFNHHLRSRIRITIAFYGPDYAHRAVEHFLELARVHEDPARLRSELGRTWKTVLPQHGYWTAVAAEGLGVPGQEADRVLAAIARAWPHSDLPLPRGQLLP
jgi:hypothetical protein